MLVSRSETFGVAYIEALSCGVPVIATRCGGPEGFVHTGNGILVPVDDEEALVGAAEIVPAAAIGVHKARAALVAERAPRAG